MENQTIELTDAEKALILAQRQKEEAAKAEKEAKLAIEREKKIARMKVEVAEFNTKQVQLAVATERFFNELRDEAYHSYKLDVASKIRHFSATEYDYSSSPSKTITLAGESVTYDEYKIVYIGENLKYNEKAYQKETPREIYIEIEFENGEYCMKINGAGIHERKYRRAGKVNLIIQEHLTTNQNALQRKQKSLSAQEQAIVKLTEQFDGNHDYPKSVVEKYQIMSGGHQITRHRYSPTTYTDAVLVSMPNGVQIVYRTSFTTENVLDISIYSLNHSSIHVAEVLNAIKNLSAKPKA